MTAMTTMTPYHRRLRDVVCVVVVASIASTGGSGNADNDIRHKTMEMPKTTTHKHTPQNDGDDGGMLSLLSSSLAIYHHCY